MTTRDRLYQLIDELPESELPAVERFLEARSDPVLRALMDAPIDDELETEQERAAIAEADAQIARGELIDDEDLWAELGRLHADAD